MSKINSLEDVVTSGLCAGCGLCESLAGREHVHMELNDLGFARPRFAPGSPVARSRQILDVCPGATLHGPEATPGVAVHAVWGPMLELRRTWATDAAVRHRSAAGGTVTALACYLLDHGLVDRVLHVRTSADQPTLTDAAISATPAEVIAGARSRYGPVAPLVHVHRLLDEGHRFAIVAKPCDISAIGNLARHDARVDVQIPYKITYFCGGIASAGTPEQIAAHHGVPSDRIAAFHWRGEGWPGPTRVVSDDGETFDMSYEDTWFKPWPWTTPMQLQWRCKVCPDAVGESADLACPDGWLLEDGAPVRREAQGVNAVVVRTPAGRELLEGALRAGYVAAAPLSLTELEQMHSDHLPRKLGHPARRAGMALAGRPTPRVHGYRSLAAIRRAGARASLSALWGTFKRVRAGRHREPSPVEAR